MKKMRKKRWGKNRMPPMSVCVSSEMKFYQTGSVILHFLGWRQNVKAILKNRPGAIQVKNFTDCQSVCLLSLFAPEKWKECVKVIQCCW